MKQIVCVSIPRTGHQYFESLLRTTLGDRFGYCETYNDLPSLNSFEPCCKTVPCVRAKNRHFDVFLQKNHDFGLNVDVGESVGVVVQVRNPISVIFSYFEFSVKHGHINNTEEDFINFAAKTSRFYIKFWNRWVTDEKNHVILYE